MSIKESAGQERASDLVPDGSTSTRSLHDEAAIFHSDSSVPPRSTFSKTDEALARLDAASEAADKRRLGAASLRKIWPMVFFGAGAAFVLAISAGLIWIENEPERLSAVSTAMSLEGGNQPFVLVSFNDRAMISDVTNALHELGLEISAGPLPGGVYRVTIPVETGPEYDALTASLEQLPSVGWLVAGRRPEG